MSNNKVSFGKSTWDEETGNGKGRGMQNNSDRPKDAWMRLERGSNKVRVVTKPYSYLSCKYTGDGAGSFGDKVMCSMPTETDPLVKMGAKPKKRWFVGVIDRKTNTGRILDISTAIYNPLKELNNEESWGDPSGYDINIKVNPDGGATGYYTVVPLGKSPLSEADLKVKATIDEDSLAQRVTPPTADWVLARVNAIRTKKGFPAMTVDMVTAPTNGSSTTVVDMSDDDVTFPVHD